MKLLEYHEQSDLINRKTATLPKYDPRKKDLPNRSDYVGATAWLRAVQARIGDPIVYALDDALMCQNRFGGRSNEFIMWLYGSDQTTRFNGVVVLGNHSFNYNRSSNIITPSSKSAFVRSSKSSEQQPS